MANSSCEKCHQQVKTYFLADMISPPHLLLRVPSDRGGCAQGCRCWFYWVGFGAVGFPASSSTSLLLPEDRAVLS